MATKALTSKQSLFVGVTLFSMFFGAGNLILPPLLGLQASGQTAPAMAGFLVTGIGLPMLGIISVGLAGTVRKLASRVHPLFAHVFVAAVYLAIGPCLAIPRTSSTSFEMLQPLLPADISLETARLVFSIAFFVVAYVLALRPNALTKLLGRITGPALIVLIVFVVGGALIHPGGADMPVQPPYDSNAPLQGFFAGYQTMDLLASLTFGIVIAANIRQLGVTDESGLTREVSRAGVFAGLLMGAIYCGLAYVGVTMAESIPEATNGAAILTASATAHFGLVGTVAVAIIFLLACLNVCIGLISCCGTYFADEFRFMPYRAWALAFAIFSCVVSNFGLDAILTFSVPLLNALYPMAIVLVSLGTLHRVCGKFPLLYPWAVGIAGVVSVTTAMRDAFFKEVALPFDAIPLANAGLGWVLPACVGLLIGVLASKAIAGRSTKASA